MPSFSSTPCSRSQSDPGRPRDGAARLPLRGRRCAAAEGNVLPRILSFGSHAFLLGVALWHTQNFTMWRETMFEKAQRKVAEYTFFLRHLRETQDPDATE